MKPIRTPHTNAIYKLKGGTDENDLPVEQSLDESGNPCLVSTWQLDDEERAAIAQGGTISLCVWGDGTPPVSLAVNEP